MERLPKFETPPDPAPASEPEKPKTPFQEVMDAEEQRQEQRAAQKAQESVVKNIVDYLKGESSFRRSDLSEEERGLLEHMSAEVRKNMRENPYASAVNLDFSKNPDAYRIWSGLVNRMTRERLASPIPEQKETMERLPKFETPPDPAPASEPEKPKTPFQEVMDAEEQRQEQRAAQKAQESVVKNIVDYLKGESSFRRSDLSEEERGLLEHMSAEVRKNMRENPYASAVNLDFSKNPDAYRIWSGLVNRMTRERLASPIPEQKETEA